MSKRWADECSSDEDEEVEEEVPAPQKETPTSVHVSTGEHQEESFVAFISSIVPSGGDNTRRDIGIFFEKKGCRIRNLDTREEGEFYVAKMVFQDAESLDFALNVNGEEYKAHPLRVSKTYENRPSVGRSHGGRGGGRHDHRGERDRSRDSDNNFGGRRGPARDDYRGGRGGGRGGREVAESRNAPAAPAPPAQRPKLVLAPRTLPIETIGKAEPSKPDIFGGGKAHDEIAYEEVKKKLVVETPKPAAEKPTVLEGTVFHMDALKEAVLADAINTASASEAGGAGRAQASAGTGPKGGRDAGRGGADGRWSRDTEGDVHGRGRGGRGTGDGAGRGRGSGRGPPRLAAAAAAAEGGSSAADAPAPSEAPAHGSYVIQKPVDDASEPPSGAHRAGGRGRGRGDGGRDGAGRKPREEGAGVGRGGRTTTRPGPQAGGNAAGEQGAGTLGHSSTSAGAGAGIGGHEGDKERVPRARAGGDGKLFAATAKRTNLLQSKPKGVVAGEAAGGDAPAAAAPSAPALTEEEKFAKAQEKFAGKEKATAGLGSKPKPVSTFAALGSDSDDE